MARSWYQITNLSDSEVQVSIHDEIGYWGISAQEFMRDWAAIPQNAEITLSINSPGGEVFDGLAIYHTIARDSARVTARIEGWAASAASFIAMAAGKIVMPENAWLMIHNPATGAWGESSDLRSAADLLEKLEQTLVSVYNKRTGLDADEITQMLNSETWMNGADALEKGFVDEVEDAVSMVACASKPAADRLRSISANIPESVRASLEEKPPEDLPGNEGDQGDETAGDEQLPTDEFSAAEIVAACEAAGFPALSLDLVQASSDQVTVNQRLADAKSITAICAAGNQPEAAEKLIAAGIPVNEAAAKLIQFRAKNTADISNAQGSAEEFFTPPANQQAPQATGRKVDARGIYNKRGSNRA